MIYEMKCVNDHEFEVDRPIGQLSGVECPVCKTTDTKKVYRLAGIDFKGPGFYKNDYAKKDTGV